MTFALLAFKPGVIDEVDNLDVWSHKEALGRSLSFSRRVASVWTNLTVSLANDV